MNRQILKRWFDSSNMDPKLFNKMFKYWDTILAWSGYEYYQTVKEIAYDLKIKPKTVENRIAWFKRNLPEVYEKAKADRAAIKATTIRQAHNAQHPASYEPSKHDEFIVEKF
jgi:hypothetical protein